MFGILTQKKDGNDKFIFKMVLKWTNSLII